MKKSNTTIRLAKYTLVAAALMAFAGTANAQGTADAKAAGKPIVRPSGNPSRDTLMKMQTPITIEQSNTRLGAVLDFIQKETGVTMDVIAKSDRLNDALDREAEVSASYKDMPALTVLEKVLARYTIESGNACTWQLNEVGTLQVGLKSSLNKMKRLEIYDINDLLFVMPVYDEAPEIDLEKVLQNNNGGGGGGGGGGGSQGSPFKQNQNRNRDADQDKTREERARDLITLITETVDTEQWHGDFPAPRYYQGNIIVDAPDYMHRQLVGYKFWPSQSRTVSQSKRYVTLTTDNAINKIKSIENVPVTGSTGGGTGGGGGAGSPPGGGG